MVVLGWNPVKVSFKSGVVENGIGTFSDAFILNPELVLSRAPFILIKADVRVCSSIIERCIQL